MEEKHVIRRLLPHRYNVWKRKRDQRLDKKAKDHAKKLKEWVGCVICTDD